MYVLTKYCMYVNSEVSTSPHFPLRKEVSDSALLKSPSPFKSPNRKVPYIHTYCTYIRTYIHTYIHTYCTYIYICTRACIFIHTYTIVYVYVHTYTLFYVHTYLHKHSYVYTIEITIVAWLGWVYVAPCQHLGQHH